MPGCLCPIDKRSQALIIIIVVSYSYLQLNLKKNPLVYTTVTLFGLWLASHIVNECVQ